MKSNALPLRAGPPGADQNRNKKPAMYVAGITVLLAFLYAAQSIAVTNSKTDGVYMYDPNSSVMLTELMKLMLAGGLFFSHLSRSKAPGGPEPPKFAVTGSLIIKFAIPALIYMIGNNLLYLALRYLDAPTYQILGNTKIVVVAMVQRMMLKSKKTVIQWLGVALLMLGMMVIASGKLAESSGNEAVRRRPCGVSAISLTPPPPSLLRRLLTVAGGAAELKRLLKVEGVQLAVSFRGARWLRARCSEHPRGAGGFLRLPSLAGDAQLVHRAHVDGADRAVFGLCRGVLGVPAKEHGLLHRCGPPQHGLSSKTMALITSDCGATCYLSITWP